MIRGALSRPSRRAGSVLGAALALLLGASGAAGHHVGVYVPRDNEVSANFKQIKFSLQAKKFDVALRLFEEGALRAELRAQAARLPEGLEGNIRSALDTRDAAAAERGLMIFFAALVRDLALEADRRLAEPSDSIEARGAAAQKFLEAIWRYYNLVDFTVSQYDGKSAAAVRLAFDEAETYAKGPAASGGWWSWLWRWADSRPTAGPARRAADPSRVREPLQRIAQALSGLIETTSPATRRLP